MTLLILRCASWKQNNLSSYNLIYNHEKKVVVCITHLVFRLVCMTRLARWQRCMGSDRTQFRTPGELEASALGSHATNSDGPVINKIEKLSRPGLYCFAFNCRSDGRMAVRFISSIRRPNSSKLFSSGLNGIATRTAQCWRVWIAPYQTGACQTHLQHEAN